MSLYESMIAENILEIGFNENECVACVDLCRINKMKIVLYVYIL